MKERQWSPAGEKKKLGARALSWQKNTFWHLAEVEKKWSSFVKEEKKRRSGKFSQRMRKGEYKDLVFKILSEISLKRQWSQARVRV